MYGKSNCMVGTRWVRQQGQKLSLQGNIRNKDPVPPLAQQCNMDVRKRKLESGDLLPVDVYSWDLLRHVYVFSRVEINLEGR